MAYTIMFWVLAGAYNAVMDVMTTRWHRSIFKNIENKFWFEFFEHNSWDNKYRDEDPKKGRLKWSFLSIDYIAPVQLLDGWHFSKMLSIIFYGMSLITYAEFGGFNLLDSDLSYFVDLLILGTTRNLTFSLFYKHILIKK